MAHSIEVAINASRFTTRDGSHPDDEVYVTQVKEELERKLKEMRFTRHTVVVKIK